MRAISCAIVHFKSPVAIAVIVVALIPHMSSSPSDADMSLTMATNALLALSVALALGQGGVFSMAQATFATCGAYITAILSTRLEVSPWIGLIPAVVVPGLDAFVMARFLVRLSPLILALATLMIAEIVVAIIQQAEGLTGGYLGISGIPGVPGLTSLVALQLFAWLCVVIVAAGLANFASSQQGRAARTIAHDQLLARSMGIAVTTRLSVLFGASAAIAGLAGWLYAHTRVFLGPESLPPLLSFTVIIMVLLGGSRTVMGPVAGAVLLTMLDDKLPTGAFDDLFYGLAIIVILLIIPRGVAGTEWRQLLRRSGDPTRTEDPV